MTAGARIKHHGAIAGVTGSCHELFIDSYRSVLIDCGLFQGVEASPGGASRGALEIDFDLSAVQALLVTHCHIDHVGRIPYLLAAGFEGKIYCSEPTAVLLPLVLEDAVKVGFTRNEELIRRFLEVLKSRIKSVAYGRWVKIPGNRKAASLQVRFQPAGHILGSAYIECKVANGRQQATTVLFSGDLGAPYAPLLPAPKPAYGSDILIIESTYGDTLHEGRQERHAQLQAIIERCFRNRGMVLIPAFSIGRTQELLYELEQVIYRFGDREVASGLRWRDLEIVVDSPLANRFTRVYRKLSKFWDQEAKRVKIQGRHPLAFEQLTTIGSHEQHLATVAYLARSPRPTVVIAASGMCAGGRIVNYLKALVENPKTDIVLVGYQAAGTPGRAIQQYGPQNGYVELEGRRYTVNAQVHTLAGYSAHADQKDLLGFVRRMKKKPKEIRIVHGEQKAKAALSRQLQRLLPQAQVKIP